MKIRPSPLLLLAALSLSTPAAVLAHSAVETSSPKEGATVKALKAITLNFEEAMLPPTATTQLVMTAMPGKTTHVDMAIKNYTSAWSNRNRTLALSLKQPLKPGSYELRWQAAGADGHRMKGTLHFKVS